MADQLSRVFAALADPTRRDLVTRLTDGDATVGDLAGFLSVNAEPGPDYGKFTLLEFPAGESVESPAQIQNDIESDNKISKALTLQRGGNSKVVLGNLLTIPLGGKILYVEPVYTKAQGGNSFPILRHVIAVYGNGQPAFKPTLKAALTGAFANDAARSR
jgi:uncharacterized membrane protein (UPF0182 family)